jgi:hypothetical protein
MKRTEQLVELVGVEKAQALSSSTLSSPPSFCLIISLLVYEANELCELVRLIGVGRDQDLLNLVFLCIFPLSSLSLFFLFVYIFVSPAYRKLVKLVGV